MLAAGEMAFAATASGWRVVEVFRRCPACGQRNIVRDNDFTCALCDHALPAQWNFATD